MSVEKYNTNLAAEYYVLSILHRRGVDANLTIGNKKSVDVVVVRDAGKTFTVDVKGLAGTTNWPVNNVKVESNHFIVLVCFLGKIFDANVLPEVYVVPSSELDNLTYESPHGRRGVTLSRIRKDGQYFKDKWELLESQNS